MANKASIIILGSRGFIGSYLFNSLSETHNVLADSNYLLEDLFHTSFFLHHNISLVVNCIGSYRYSNQYFSSNFLLPLHIANFLNNFSCQYNRPIALVHMSSVGIASPYTSLSLTYTPHSPFSRQEVSVDSYEFSKLVFETFLVNLDHTPLFTSYSLLLSNVVSHTSLTPMFTVCALLSPFRLDCRRFLPVTLFSDILRNIEMVLAANSPTGSHQLIPTYSRQSILKFFPRICFSYLKIPFPTFFISFLFPFRNYPIISRIFRFFVFLYHL